MLNSMLAQYQNTNIILKISIGIILGVLVGLYAPNFVDFTAIFGDIFVGSLKSIAPILVFILVLCAIATKEYSDGAKKIKNVIFLYLVGTFLASVCAVIVSFIFPVKLALNIPASTELLPPTSVSVILKDLLFKMIDNPINAIIHGNYIGILTWSIASAIALKKSSTQTKQILQDINNAVLKIVKFIVGLAPFGIFGLVSYNIKTTGINIMLDYIYLLCVLVGTMLFVMFVINPLLAFLQTKKNPFPLLKICLRHSALYAFFTRSSAANIPVNMQLCSKINVDKELYSISIPLGGAINTAGAAVTIAILALSAAHTLGIQVGFTQALILSFLAAFAACGASGVAGGSLLLVPLACSLFGISNDIAIQVVGVGFIIGVIQDSVETALNSSTDVLFSAICSNTEINLKGI